jgi:hypothetical protein
MTTCPTCGADPCVNPGFCAACRDADRRKARGEQPRHIEPHRWRTAPLNEARPTPQTTIEAIMYCVRERGLAALKEPANVARLSTCDAAAKAQIDKRVAKILQQEEIAQ